MKSALTPLAYNHTEVIWVKKEKKVTKMADTKQQIMETCESVAAMLTDKNTKYGDSAISPVKVFSKLDAANSLAVRMDDKISRLMNNKEIRRDDLTDLVGYCILFMISQGWTGYDGDEMYEDIANTGDCTGCDGCSQRSPW